VTEADFARSAPIRKFADKPGQRLAQDVGDFGRDPNEGVWNVFGVVLPGPYVPALGPVHGHHGAAAHCKVRQQERDTQKDACATHGRPSPHGTLTLMQAIMSDPRGSYLEFSGNGVFYTRVAAAPHRWTGRQRSSNTTPMIENTPNQAVEAHPPREGEPIM